MFRSNAVWIAAIVLCVVSVSSASAQSDATTKGNMMFAGAVSFRSVDTEGLDDRTTSWTMAPKALYFVADHVSIGAEINFNAMTQGSFGLSSHDYLAILQVVLPTNNEAIQLYGEAGGGFARSTIESSTSEFIFNGYAFKAGAGIYLFINDHVSITPQLSFIYESFGDDGTATRGNDQSIFFALGINGFLLP